MFISSIEAFLPPWHQVRYKRELNPTIEPFQHDSEDCYIP